MIDRPDFNSALIVNFKEVLERRRVDAEKTRRSGNRRPPKFSRRKFRADFIIFPMRWIVTLEHANADRGMYRLALRLLAEAHVRDHRGGKIVLSSEVAGLPRNSKRRAAEKLQALGLIHIERRATKQSPIIHVLTDPAEEEI
jgi:hypothetical protein